MKAEHALLEKNLTWPKGVSEEWEGGSWDNDLEGRTGVSPTGRQAWEGGNEQWFRHRHQDVGSPGNQRMHLEWRIQGQSEILKDCSRTVERSKGDARGCEDASLRLTVMPIKEAWILC